MEKLRDPKLWKGVGLAVGLYAFTVVPSFVYSRPASAWGTEVWTRLAPILTVLPVILAALVGSEVLRNGRDSRLAAWIGAVGGLLVALWQEFWPLATAKYWLPGNPVSATDTLVISLSRSLYYAPLLAIVCWIGADYRSSVSWEAFKKGPSGAIVKGALAGGAVGFVLTLGYYQWVVRPMFESAGYGIGSGIFEAFHNFSNCALVTAGLAAWRPSRGAGAFAGAGLGTGLLGLQNLSGWLWNWQQELDRQHQESLGVHWGHHPHPALPALPLYLTIAGYLMPAIIFAIAGSFAGRWEPEPISADATE